MFYSFSFSLKYLEIQQFFSILIIPSIAFIHLIHVAQTLSILLITSLRLFTKNKELPNERKYFLHIWLFGHLHKYHLALLTFAKSIKIVFCNNSLNISFYWMKFNRQLAHLVIVQSKFWRLRKVWDMTYFR